MDILLKHILKNEYGLINVDISTLYGYANVNYDIQSGDGRFILKQYRDEPGLKNLITSENKVLKLLSNKILGYFQQPIYTLGGSDYVTRMEGDRNLVFRLLKYIDGDLMAKVKHTPNLYSSLGRILAQMDTTLLDYRDSSIESRRYEWDILHIDQTREQASYIQDPSDRKLVDYYYQQYNEFVRPRVPEMRKSIIYADANDLNILVKDDTIAGLIDFGDLMYTVLVSELAIALAYGLFDKDDPLQWAVPIIKGYCEVLPLEEIELDCLYYLVAARLCIIVTKAAYSKSAFPDNEYLTVSEKPAWKLLHKWITINPLKAKNEFRTASNIPAVAANNIDASLAERFKHVSKALSVSYRKPIKMEKAAFQYMYDAEGQTYLDARNNISHVGHCHPKVTAASQHAMLTLNTNTRYVYDELNAYAARLIKKFSGPLNKVFFVNSGSAASDLALRLAYTHTQKEKVLVMEQGYHGNTTAAIDISHYKFSSLGGNGRKENILMAPSFIPDQVRTIELIGKEEGNIAAFIAEPIIGCAGQIPLPADYFKEIYPVIRQQGGVCISDEVQTGFGRLGEVFWGFELYDVVPDIVILGKPIGNGHPMAAVITTDKIAESFDNGMEFFSSFGGNPVSCAIGLAVLDVIEEEHLQDNALKVGNYLKERLIELKDKHSCIGDVRGAGLFLGVEFIKDTKEPATDLTSMISNVLKDRYIMVGVDGPYENVIKIKPPLCFTSENANQLVDALDDVLGSL